MAAVRRENAENVSLSFAHNVVSGRLNQALMLSTLERAWDLEAEFAEHFDIEFDFSEVHNDSSLQDISNQRDFSYTASVQGILFAEAGSPTYLTLHVHSNGEVEITTEEMTATTMHGGDVPTWRHPLPHALHPALPPCMRFLRTHPASSDWDIFAMRTKPTLEELQDFGNFVDNYRHAYAEYLLTDAAMIDFASEGSRDSVYDAELPQSPGSLLDHSDSDEGYHSSGTEVRQPRTDSEPVMRAPEPAMYRVGVYDALKVALRLKFIDAANVTTPALPVKLQPKLPSFMRRASEDPEIGSDTFLVPVDTTEKQDGEVKDFFKAFKESHKKYKDRLERVRLDQVALDEKRWAQIRWMR